MKEEIKFDSMQDLSVPKVKKEIGLSYDDVLLIPQKSDVYSRRDVDTSTLLTNKIKLNIPIVSANMDTITENQMAIAMAREGGIGIIHRFLSVEQQVSEVLKVKRSEGIMIERPYTINMNQTLRDAKSFMKEHNVSGLLVTDDDGKLKGILTTRDIIFEDNENVIVEELMTKDVVTAPVGAGIEKAKEIIKQYKIEKIPVVDEDKNIYGLITSKDIIKRSMYPKATKDKKGRLIVGGAIGVRGDYLQRAKELMEAKCDVLVVDVAHGHTQSVISTIKMLKKEFGDVQVIGGNIATGEAAEDLISAGADAIKAGVGPGCFAAGTRVLMSNGIYKNIEEIKQGERIINMEGKPVTVKNVFCTGIRKVVKMRSSTFYDDTLVTQDHKYFVGDLNTSSIITLQSRGYSRLLQQQTKTKLSKFKWKEVDNLKRDVLLLPRNIEFEMKEDFKVVLKKRNGGNNKNNIKFEVDCVLTPSYELGYIFGTFLGDGTSRSFEYKGSHSGSVHWYFGKYEIEIVNELSKCIFKIFGKQPKIEEQNNIYKINFYYKPFADFLHHFKKRNEKHLPEEYLVKNMEYLLGLLKGLIDSDGNTEKGGRINFTNTSYKLIELFNIVTYLVTGVFPNNRKREKSIGNLKGANIENFSNSYRARIINTGKKRLTKNYQISKILEKTDINLEIPVYDLEIDCPTHSFIANNSIVHNSVCSTRIVTGSGVPQFSAVMDCVNVGEKYNIPVIADGGIKVSGDIAKAIGAGAHSVMLGNLLAGTDETPGRVIFKKGRRFKIYRGMAGFGAADGKNEKIGNIEKDLSDVVPEGVEGTKEYKGNVQEVIFQLLGGLRSGMSYCGAHSIEELRKKARFVRISASGMVESKPHDLDIL